MKYKRGTKFSSNRRPSQTIPKPNKAHDLGHTQCYLSTIQNSLFLGLNPPVCGSNPAENTHTHTHTSIQGVRLFKSHAFADCGVVIWLGFPPVKPVSFRMTSRNWCFSGDLKRSCGCSSPPHGEQQVG